MDQNNFKGGKKFAAACCMLAAALFGGGAAHAQTVSMGTDTQIMASGTIQKVADLHFGKIIPGPAASTVTVNENTGARTVTGSAVAFGGTVSAARFNTSAQPLIIYRITMPNAIQISNGSQTMTVDQFRLNIPAVRLLPFLAPRLNSFQVGGRLNVGANQAPGVYSGTFTVTIDYL